MNVRWGAVLGLCAFRLERDLQARARRLGVTLQRASGGLGAPSFQPARGLGRSSQFDILPDMVQLRSTRLVAVHMTLLAEAAELLPSLKPTPISLFRGV
jgi:hypothetical protein